jgi:hypothetical protein
MVPHAPYFAERQRIQEEFRQGLEEDPTYLGSINHITGRYEASWLVDGDYTRQDIPGSDLYLAGLEVRLADRIDTLLATHKDGSKPDVALDIGGGVGVTWLKLATKYQQEIRSGRLILAVTNYAKHPLDHLAWLATVKGKAKQARKAAALYERCNEGVQYIDYFDFTDSMDCRLRLPSGKWFDAEGNVGLMHERFSLTAWGCVPEVNIPRAADHLSSRGTYLVPRTDQDFHPYMLSIEEQRGRRLGILAAHAALPRQYGLQLITKVEAGQFAGQPMEYIAFRGPDSQPISVG